MATINLTCTQCKTGYVLVTSPAIAARQKFCGKSCTAKNFKQRIPDFVESVGRRLSDRSKRLDNGCIVYTGQNNGVYGQVEYRRKTYTSHRASYLIHKGEIPRGMCVCHSCDNPLCINPDHLWLGTYKDNVRDMMDKGRAKYNPRKKISDERFAALVGRIEAGALHRQIAEEFGVSSSYVSMVKTGKRRSGNKGFPSPLESK